MVEYARAKREVVGVASLKKLFRQHPYVVACLALAIGMVSVLLYASKDVGLLPGQLAALVVATIALAAACTWIISWE